MDAVQQELRLGRRVGWPRTGVLAAVTGERLAYAAVFAVALVLRVVHLADKPFHHDESLHAWFSWLLATGQHFHYDPAYHGPVQQYVVASLYFLGGVGDFTARLGPALVGTVLTVLPYFLRRQLGSVAAFSASVVFCISPSYLYFSRFVREDIYAACITLGLIVLVFRFLERPRRWHPAAILGLLAVSFATKESTYITVFVIGSFFLLAAGYEARRARGTGQPAASARLVATVRSVGLDAWIWGAATFAFVFTILFTFFLLEPKGLRDGLYDAISYWLSQNDVNRGGQPWFYYLFLTPLYELPVVLLGAVGIVAALRRRTLFRLFLVWTFVLSLIIYSWAGERMPWLILHPLLPLVLLAGIGFQALWRRSTWTRGVAAAGAAAGAAFLMWGSVSVSYDHPADPAEILVFTQTSADVPPIVDELSAIDRRVQAASGRPASVYVEGVGGSDWPWAWYLRNLSWISVDPKRPRSATAADALLLTDPGTVRRLRPVLTGYRGRRFKLREWWVVDYGGASPGDVWRWFVRREAWSEKGALYQWFYVRKDLAQAAAGGSSSSS
jgi:uncharacterized protein (TIGR03663 family)